MKLYFVSFVISFLSFEITILSFDTVILSFKIQILSVEIPFLSFEITFARSRVVLPYPFLCFLYAEHGPALAHIGPYISCMPWV